MELELHGWKVRAALIALGVAIVAIPLLRAVEANKGRAEGWHRRAVVAEESVSGLRVVIADRSRALNRRTVQANRLVTQLHSNRASLQQSKVNVSSLTQRQKTLAKENARTETKLDALQSRTAALERIARHLDSCTNALLRASGPAAGKNAAKLRSLRTSCAQASADLSAYLARDR